MTSYLKECKEDTYCDYTYLRLDDPLKCAKKAKALPGMYCEKKGDCLSTDGCDTDNHKCKGF